MVSLKMNRTCESIYNEFLPEGIPTLSLFNVQIANNLDHSLMQWDKPEDRIAVIGLGFTAIIAFWASINVVAVRA